MPEETKKKSKEAKSDKKVESTSSLDVKPTEQEKPAVVATKKKPKAAEPKKKRYSFEQWLVRRAVPVHHRGGMRAYIKRPQKPRTLEEWDEVMKNY